MDGLTRLWLPTPTAPPPPTPLPLAYSLYTESVISGVQKKLSYNPAVLARWLN